MREKELRIALVCYGGVSLAVYMHGITKEVWKLAQASRAFRLDEPPQTGSQRAYHRLLTMIAQKGETRLRVLPDILSGASAGGMNAVFLAEALVSGRSLDPLTRLWLEKADSDLLIAPDAMARNRLSKFWATPLVKWTLKRPGNAINRTVAPETRAELREKLSRLMRSRWFAPPFSGIGFSRLIDDALLAMDAQPAGPPLLPPRHPIDLFVTATDFHGHRSVLKLHSPDFAVEAEHRLPISFRARSGDGRLAARPELVFAARATASFPGAFPPLRIGEIDTLLQERGAEWPGRERFVRRIMPQHIASGNVEDVALIDGAVLAGRPFAEAIGALDNRPSMREVDRRFVYIDPHPPQHADAKSESRSTGFFSTIFGALSSIPREQPIRDDIERIAQHSQEAERARAIVDALRPEVEAVVDRLFGRTLFLDRPTPARLGKWRNKAQQAAARQSGFAFHGYAKAKYTRILDTLAETIRRANPDDAPPRDVIVDTLTRHFDAAGLDRLAGDGGGASEAAISFFRTYDIAFRVRRLRLLARRLLPVGESGIGGQLTAAEREDARDTVFKALALYGELEQIETLGEDFAVLAADALRHPERVMARLADRRDLRRTDAEVDAMLADAMAQLPRDVRRTLLLSYLGFPFYDIATLPILGGRGPDEFDPIKVDRISPEDANAIRSGGAAQTLRGVEFYRFGAFFSRTYRENDYLWGRLQGADRLIDITASTLDADHALPPRMLRDLKRETFDAILDEEDKDGNCNADLIARLRAEIAEKFDT